MSLFVLPSPFLSFSICIIFICISVISYSLLVKFPWIFPVLFLSILYTFAHCVSLCFLFVYLCQYKCLFIFLHLPTDGELKLFFEGLKYRLHNNCGMQWISIRWSIYSVMREHSVNRQVTSYRYICLLSTLHEMLCKQEHAPVCWKNFKSSLFLWPLVLFHFCSVPFLYLCSISISLVSPSLTFHLSNSILVICWYQPFS